MNRVMNRREFMGLAAGGAAGAAVAASGTAVLGAETTGEGLGFIPAEPVHLFFDDAEVQTVTGLERAMHRPKKEGLIEEADGRSWELGDPLSLVRDARGIFHMTYRAVWPDASVRGLHPNIGNDKAHWFRQATGYAVSRDGIRWERPELGLIDGPEGFRVAPQERWPDGEFYEPTRIGRKHSLGFPVQSFQDMAETGNVRNPRSRYLINVLKYTDTHPFADVENGGLLYAPDIPNVTGNPKWQEGLEIIWEGARRGARGAVTRVTGWDPLRKSWFELGQSPMGSWESRGGRDISRWTTKNLLEWSKEELVMPVLSDESRELKDWVEYMDLKAMRAGGLWVGQLVVFHGDRTHEQYQMPGRPGVWRKGVTEVRLVYSRNAGRSWTRVGGRTPWIPNHEFEDGFDRLVFAGLPVRVKDELWIYYGCWDGDHLVWNRDGTPFYKDRTRIPRTARAVLRWNGFVSYRPTGGAGFGEILTRPISRQGMGRLRVNAAAQRGGIRVEVLSSRTGLPLKKHTIKDCTPVTGDGTSQVVFWGKKDRLPVDLREDRVILRFEVRDADLYGFEWSA